MDVVCTECGYQYPACCSSCPECGHPTSLNTTQMGGVKQANCPNCGAPVTHAVACEYCGTAYARQVNGPQPVNGDNLNVGVAAFLGGVVGGILGS